MPTAIDKTVHLRLIEQTSLFAGTMSRASLRNRFPRAGLHDRLPKNSPKNKHRTVTAKSTQETKKTERQGRGFLAGPAGRSVLLWKTVALTLGLGMALQHPGQGRAGNAQRQRFPYAARLEQMIHAKGRVTPVYGHNIVNAYPHDRSSFTQGLLFDEGSLYESTGLYGKSTIRKAALETGIASKIRHLAPHYFGEGVAIWKDRLIQLTWRSRRGFVYDKDLNKTREFEYQTEGWGITQNEEYLIMSDGTDTLRFWEPVRFTEVKRVHVHDHGRPIRFINELEYIKGEIYANVWGTDYIAIISPQSGETTGWIDLKALVEKSGRARPDDVLNGIAYDRIGGRLFVTGKRWPKLFEIELVPLSIHR
jgi:glutamine cyclotransferase